MTHRIAAAAVALLFSASVFAPLSALAQAPAQGSPPAKARWVAPHKGLVTVEMIAAKPRRVGPDMVSVLKIKNTTAGAIALLGVEEFWYDQKGKVVSGDTQKVRRLINPGEIVEVTTKSPWKPDMYTSNFMFTHAHGKVDVKKVTKFTEK